ncbi:hypothetical protein FCV25MIE_30022 [Fagus crenata]
MVFEIFQERLRMIFNERQIQTLVLSSLSLQSILIVLGYRRKFSTSNKLIVFLWITYLLAGWFATFSLSIISNNLRKKPIDAGLDMTAFWAPFFLLYLAGPDTITAYSLEDNTLWRRQAITLVCQVGVAAFVVIRAWTNKWLNFLTLVMFIPGLIKIGERIWVLRSGSSENFKAKSLRKADPGPNYARFMEEYHTRKKEGFDVQSRPFFPSTVVPDISFKALPNVLIPDATTSQYAYKLFETFKHLFSDLILSFQDIKNSQSFFQKASHEEAFKVIEIELGLMYDVFYTKAFKVYSRAGGILRIISFSSTLIVLLVFLIIINKDDYSKDYIIISYVLLCGAIILEIYSVLLLLKSDWSMLWLSKHKSAMVDLLYKAIKPIPLLRDGNKRWSNTMGQYNLIKYCLEHKPAVKCSAMIQKFLFHYELLERYRHQESGEVSLHLKKLIFEQLRDKSNSTNNSDLTDLKKLCACKGERVLKRYGKCDDCIEKEKLTKKHESDKEIEDQQVVNSAKCLNELSGKNRNTLLDSIDKAEFDQSILLWHIATDLCYYDSPTYVDPDDQCSDRKASKLLSDYMLYLLVMRPIMLPSGIEQIRFQDTCEEAKRFFKERKTSITEEIQACLKLLEVNTEIAPSVVKGDRSKSVLFDACILAKSLNILVHQKKWELISNVWVEMLCYASAKCQWNHHAQQLSRGGELFTHVWLLMAHLGITEQFQISTGHARTTLIVH